MDRVTLNFCDEVDFQREKGNCIYLVFWVSDNDNFITEFVHDG